MSVTLIMTWDIKEGLDQEYFEFVVREWVPATNRLGLQMVAAWYTVYSIDESTPRIRAEGISETEEKMREILASEEWKSIYHQLLQYVENYSQKVVFTTGDFQI
jgi:hypothetical protein